MKKEEKEQPAFHELRDLPLPPVKGAVTDQQDAIMRPDAEMKARGIDFYDALRFELWQ